MEEKKEKSFKTKNLLLLIFTRAIQMGIIILLVRMVPVFFEFAESVRGKPFNRYDRNGIFGTGMMPLVAIIPAMLVTEYMRLCLVIKLTGKTKEEYEEYLIERMTPEAVERAKSYEANSKKLRGYLHSIKDEMGFTKDETKYLFMIFIDVKKDREREAVEKRQIEEEERAKREAVFPKREPFFSEETHKKMDEAKERIKSYLKHK